jgi:hypothetical protein
MHAAANQDVKPERLPRVQIVEHEGNVVLQTDLTRTNGARGYAYLQVFAYGDSIGAAGTGAFLNNGELMVNFDRHYPNPARNQQVH